MSSTLYTSGWEVRKRRERRDGEGVCVYISISNAYVGKEKQQDVWLENLKVDKTELSLLLTPIFP